MKTVVYQIPVEPVEEKVGKNSSTKMAAALQHINNQAYHLANRAITLFLNYLYPEPDKELLALKEGRQPINQLEEQISAIYKNQLSGHDHDQIKVLLEEKKLARKRWENQVADCQFYLNVKEKIRSEFPDFPELLRQHLLRKVVLDWLYSWMNQHAGNGFAANFPFYRHGTHLPLCYDREMVKWKKNESQRGEVQQFTLYWLNGIVLRTTFNEQDKRLPQVLNFLYFRSAQTDVRNRKLHDTLKPTLKLAGTKWTVHIPVLENVAPILAEQQAPLHIIFGFHHPICYAFGANHAKPLGIDNGNYILQQMKEFERRIQKMEADKKIGESARKEKIGRIEAARSAYIDALHAKAVKAIIELVKKGQKNIIAIEKWPIAEQEQIPCPVAYTHLPSLYDRLLCSVPQWKFDCFYNQLEKEAKRYGIYLKLFEPKWDFLQLYTDELTYTIKDKKTNKKVNRTCNLKAEQRIPSLYYNSDNLPKQQEALEGYMIFKFDREYNDTNGQLKLYSSPVHSKRKTEEFIYRIHIDFNLAMNAAMNKYS